MLDPAVIRDAVGRVHEPRLRRSLGELDLIRVDRAGEDAVTIGLILPTSDWPADSLTTQVVSAAREAGAATAAVEPEPLDLAGQEALAARLKSSRPARPGGEGSRARVICIASGKGGVGKSSVTANTAVALARAGRDVAILDADVWGFSIPRMLGVVEPPTVVGGLILPSAAHGVRVISMDFFVPPDQAVIWRGPMLHKALEQFLDEVYWDEPEYLLLDLPPGTGDVPISLSQFVPRATTLVVTTPQPTAQRVARRAGLMAAKMDQEVVGVVENMSWFTGDDGRRYELFGSGGGQALADELGVPLLGQVPLVPAVRLGADRGEPAVVAAPESEAVAAFDAIASRLAAAESPLPLPRVRHRPELSVD
jgi:ATP-binding protein involved in chromosome partitioning